jgi:hypothetical protein
MNAFAPAAQQGGPWTHLVVSDPGGFVFVALTVAACVLLLTGAVALSEVVRGLSEKESDNLM